MLQQPVIPRLGGLASKEVGPSEMVRFSLPMAPHRGAQTSAGKIQAGYNWLLKHCAPFSGGGPVSALSHTAPTPSAVLGARQLAPADVTADAGFPPCPTGDVLHTGQVPLTLGSRHSRTLSLKIYLKHPFRAHMLSPCNGL